MQRFDTQTQIIYIVNNIAYIIRTARESAEHSQEWMADSLGMSRVTYSRKERELNDFTFPEVEQIAALLGTDVPHLLGAKTTPLDSLHSLALALLSVIDERVVAAVRGELHETINAALDQREAQARYRVTLHEPEVGELPPIAAEPPPPGPKRSQTRHRR